MKNEYINWEKLIIIYLGLCSSESMAHRYWHIINIYTFIHMEGQH